MMKGTAERGGRPGICVCVCADKHNINKEIYSSDNVKIRYLEKIRLCPTKHPAPALPNTSVSFCCKPKKKQEQIHTLWPQISSTLIPMPPVWRKIQRWQEGPLKKRHNQLKLTEVLTLEIQMSGWLSSTFARQSRTKKISISQSSGS